MARTSKVIALSWEEPEQGSHAEVASLDEAGWEDVESAIEWVEGQAGDEYGVTIVRADLHPTRARGGDRTDTADVLQDLALQVRYSSGEGVYGEDCPAFLKHGVRRA